MGKKVFGTNFIGGLNVATAAHRLDPSELTVSAGGWTDEEGVWRVMPGPSTLYTGYTNIKAMAAGRMGGADHVVHLDGTTLYDNAADVGTLATDSDVVIKDFDDKFFILGATDGKNYIYDGNHLREAGPWQPTLNDKATYWQNTGTATSRSITGITLGATTVIHVAAHGLGVGDALYISGILNGPTELNGKDYEVSAVTATTISIDVDTTGLTSWSSGGDVYEGGAALDGVYKFYFTCIVKLSDGTVLEGKPRGVRARLSNHDTFDAEAITISPTDYVQLDISEYFTSSSYGSYQISGTVTTDYDIGFRIYRTKNGGTDFYLQQESYYGDDANIDQNTSGSDVWYDMLFSSFDYRFLADSELGAVYTPGSTDRGSHPKSSVMAKVGQRLLMNDEDNPTRLYFTSLDGTDYVPELNYVDMADDITAIGSAGAVGVVFSADRMWRVSLLGGIPDVDEIKTPVGTTYGDALALTDLGLLFLRDDGLWATDGASPPTKVARVAFDTITGPTAVAAYGDTVAVMGSSDLYLARRRNGGFYWHGPAISYTALDTTGGTFYAADANTIYTLFTGARGAGVIESPKFVYYAPDGTPMDMTAYRVVLDVDGDSTPTVLVNGNRYSDYEGHDDYDTERRIARLPIGRLLNHAFTVRIELSGGAGLYGYWLECDG